VNSNKGWWAAGIVLLILVIDQVLKFYIKLNYELHEDHCVWGGRLCLLFLENRGMAWGLEIPFFGKYGKPMLTIFRLAAATAIIYYIRLMIRQQAHTGFILTLSMILAGALGNIIDSVFYGLIFSESTSYQVAELFPAGGGYERFLYGHVVDMFHCPIIDTYWPSWMPFGLGGRNFVFFSPVFNVADSAITTGVILILIFQKKFFVQQTLDLQSDDALVLVNRNDTEPDLPEE
jgi:signal peptidase II